MEEDRRTDIIIHSVENILKDGTDINVRVDFYFSAETDLDGFEEGDVPEILTKIAVLRKESPYAVGVQPFRILLVDLLRYQIPVNIPRHYGQNLRIVPQRIDVLQFHEHVVITVENGGSGSDFVRDIRYP